MASPNTGVLYCVLKCSAQAVSQTPAVNAWNHHSQSFRAGAAQEMHCSEKADLAYHWDRGFSRPPSWESNTQYLLLNWAVPSAESRGAAVPSQHFRLQKRGTSSRGCLWNPQQHLPPSRCPQASRCRTICCINGIFIPSCPICSTVHVAD